MVIDKFKSRYIAESPPLLASVSQGLNKGKQIVDSDGQVNLR